MLRFVVIREMHYHDTVLQQCNTVLKWIHLIILRYNILLNIFQISFIIYLFDMALGTDNNGIHLVQTSYQY